MASGNYGRRGRPDEYLGLIVLAVLALFIGLASSVLPAWFVISTLMVPTVAVLLLVRPEFALVALVALTCGLIHPALVPRVPMLGGSVAASDATLVMLAIYALWVMASRKDKPESPPVAGARWLAVCLGLFGTSLAVAVPISLWHLEVNATWVLGETRRLLYLLTLPIAIVILEPAERQRRLVVSMVVLGCLFSIGQVLQGVFNLQVFGEKGRMVVLETMGRQEYGTTRSLTLGIEVIVFALLLTVGAHVLGVIRKAVFFPVAGLLLVGILLSFGRTTFAVVAVCLVLLVAWLNLRRLPGLVGLLLLVIALGSALVSVWKPESLAAVYYRMTSIDTEVESGDSAQWRIREAELILPQLLDRPLTGVGLGADYKGAAGSAADPDLNRYVHNGYLYMAGKMGIPALVFFLMVIGAIFVMGRRSAKSGVSARARVVGAAGAAMMVNFLLASITEPHFMEDYSLVLIAVVGALVYLGARPMTTVGGTAVAREVGALSGGRRSSGARRSR